jgi:uncharacterized protein
MKVFAISDLHLCLSGDKPMDIFGATWENYLEKITKSWNEKVSDDDIVLVAGDISWAMSYDGFLKDLEFFKGLKGHIILIRGNHDFWWSSITRVRNLLLPNMSAIQNDCIRIGNYLIGGSRGWQTPEINEAQSDEDTKIYKREVLRIEMSLKEIEKNRKDGDKVIFMIHYPPFNSLRMDSEFTKLFEKYKVDKVVYGHLHGKQVKVDLIFNKNGIDYYLTSCDIVNNTLIDIY